MQIANYKKKSRFIPACKQARLSRVFSVNGVKVDVIFERFKAVKNLTARVPYHLFEGNEVSGYFLESFLLGGMDTILYDPSGEIARVKRELNQLTSYQKLVAPIVSEWFQWIAKNDISKALELLQKDDFKGAIKTANRAVEGFYWISRWLTTLKDLKAAAEKLNIPEFYPLASQIKGIASPEKPAVEAVWKAIKALWDYSLKAAYQPLKAKLTHLGVEDVEKLELIGDYGLFWSGYRIHELGRVIAEVDLSLKWSSFELEKGDVSEALGILWGCRDSSTTIERWKRIEAALKGAGYEVSEVVNRLLEDAEFKRLAEQLDEANQRLHASAASASEEKAKLAVTLAQKLQTLLAKSLPFMPLVEVYRHNASHAYNSINLARTLALLEEVYAESDKIDEFVRFCEGRKRTVDLNSDLKFLRCWYLQEKDTRKLTGEMRLTGKDAAWQWRDPKGNCSYEFLSEGDLEIRMTSHCSLHHNHLFTAPALLLEVSGDFTLQTSVVGTGGIIVWKDEKNYLHLERHGYLKDEVRFEATVENDRSDESNKEPSSIVIGRGKLATDELQLRLSRVGSGFYAWCSKDGAEWFRCGDIEVAIKDPISAGVFGLNYSSEPTKINFGHLSVY